MPYIPQADRKRIKPLVLALFEEIKVKGHATYAVTLIYHLYLRRLVKEAGKLRYTLLSEIYGMMNDSATEFYFAVMKRYEDSKRKENGPVSEFDRQDNERQVFECKNGHIFYCPESYSSSMTSGSQCPDCHCEDYKEITL